MTIITITCLCSKLKLSNINIPIQSTLNGIVINPDLAMLPEKMCCVWTATRDIKLRKFFYPLKYRYGLNLQTNSKLSHVFLLILLAGDVARNPGPFSSLNRKESCSPDRKRRDIQPNKEPTTATTKDLNCACKECGKNVHCYQNALLCAECNYWYHIDCQDLTKSSCKYFSNNLNIAWTCSLCSLPFRNTDLSSEATVGICNSPSNIQGDTANQFLEKNSITEERKVNSSGTFIMHLNINSIQNKFEELKLLNDDLEAHVLVISETKIDASYQIPNSNYMDIRCIGKTGQKVVVD